MSMSTPNTLWDDDKMVLTSEDALPSRHYHDLGRPSRSGISHYIFRRQFIASCVALAIVSVAALALFTLVTTPAQLQALLPIPPVTEVEDAQSFVLGPPTQSFRDNLRNDTKYITSWLNAGWTNDVMTIGNLLYLALITERVPILTSFVPSHIGPEAPPIPFGHVFDVPRLSKALRIPVLEWDQVKDVNSSTLDELGCWAVWPVVAEGASPRDSDLISLLSLDLSYTRAPDWVKLTPPGIDDKHVSLWSLARLAYPEARQSAMSQPPDPSPQHQAWEWNWDYSPVWRFVGQHMHWNATLENLAEEHARRAMNVSDNEPTPPCESCTVLVVSPSLRTVDQFISIHMRHGDFRIYCNEYTEDQCFVPLPAIARRVAEIQQELLDRKGINVTHVIMTSDERDPNWWAEVRNYGWTWVDYAAERTVEKHGRWYPVLLDAILQSRGVGFIGTEYSTMSLLAFRRVQDWHDGAVRMAKWGWPGADDH
ncbi:hypothetical protein EDC04DRAFT_36455 [Pisolithus marmoratus]|nr:hypothetical protein EDC04DRAFT_36455 [Pisolithus marmoratus]